MMSQAEFSRWISFYQMHPFDDMHRYHRPAAFIARSMAGGELSQMLKWLHPDYSEPEYSDEDLRTFKALGVDKPPRRS